MVNNIKNILNNERSFLLDKLSSLNLNFENNLNNINILEFILENATDGYWDWYITKDYEYLSPTFKKQLGYEDDEMENHPSSWQELADPKDLKNIFDKVNEHFKTKGKTKINSTIKFRHKKGHIVEILCRGNVVEWDENDKPIRMVGTHTIVKEYF